MFAHYFHVLSTYLHNMDTYLAVWANIPSYCSNMPHISAIYIYAYISRPNSAERWAVKQGFGYFASPLGQRPLSLGFWYHSALPWCLCTTTALRALSCDKFKCRALCAGLSGIPGPQSTAPSAAPLGTLASGAPPCAQIFSINSQPKWRACYSASLAFV